MLAPLLAVLASGHLLAASAPWNAALIPVFAGACLMSLLTPGPVFAILAQNTVRLGWRGGITTCAGVMCGRTVVALFAVAALSWSAVWIRESIVWISYAGATFLVWKAMRAAKQEAATRPTRHRWVAANPALDGFVAALCNPVNLVFLLTLLPQFIDASAVVQPQLLGLALIYLASALGVAMTWLVVFHAGAVHLQRLRSCTLVRWAGPAIYLGVAANVVSGAWTLQA
jgi:threonine/homoserine/homoserine lactone efflux protein